MESVGVNASRKYVVHIGAGLLREIPSVWTPVYNMCKLLVVTDDTVDKLYADSVLTAVNERGFDAKKFVIPHVVGWCETITAAQKDWRVFFGGN